MPYLLLISRIQRSHDGTEQQPDDFEGGAAATPASSEAIRSRRGRLSPRQLRPLGDHALLDLWQSPATEADVEAMRVQLAGIGAALDELETQAQEAPAEEQERLSAAVAVLKQRREDIVRSVDEIEAMEAGPEEERERLDIEVQRELAELDKDVNDLQAEFGEMLQTE